MTLSPLGEDLLPFLGRVAITGHDLLYPLEINRDVDSDNHPLMASETPEAPVETASCASIHTNVAPPLSSPIATSSESLSGPSTSCTSFSQTPSHSRSKRRRTNRL